MKILLAAIALILASCAGTTVVGTIEGEHGTATFDERGRVVIVLKPIIIEEGK